MTNKKAKSNPDTESDRSAQDHNDEDPMVTRYFTEDGTPVEPSTIPPEDSKQPNLSARPDVHERTIRASDADKQNERDIDQEEDGK